jgi:hypothetical protein
MLNVIILSVIMVNVVASSTGLHSTGRLLANGSNVSHGWQWQTRELTIVITTVKSFIVQASGVSMFVVLRRFTLQLLSQNQGPVL